MPNERPDLSGLPGEVLEYIEQLEAEVRALSATRSGRAAEPAAPVEPSEPPTTINVITMTAGGAIKRTPRHFYPRQRRAGMGIFDIDTPEEDPPAHVALADEAGDVILLTGSGSMFLLPVNQIPETPVRGRGAPLSDLLKIPAGEKVVFIGPLKTEGSLAMVSARGYVRVLRHNYVSANYTGTPLLDAARFGPLAAAQWLAENEDEVFIATERGQAIRFRAKLVHLSGSLGIRLDRGDAPAAVCGTNESGGVFLLGEDGRGTIRLMEGFRSNKAPGAGGKAALKTDRLISAASVREADDILIISRLSKVIRFQAEEIPAKTGVVQGVICMGLRADTCAAAAVAAL